MVERYRILLIVIKYLPFVIGLCYFIASILSCIGVGVTIVPFISQLSILSSLSILLTSFAFKFCIWHRLPIYYCWNIDAISFIDIKWGIPVQNHIMLMIYLIIAIAFSLLGMCLKQKYNNDIRRISRDRKNIHS